MTVAGQRTGAAIAAALAARHPKHMTALILDGMPLYTLAERAERLGKPPLPQTLSPAAVTCRTITARSLVMPAPISTPESPPIGQ